jgi:hypothetical protein
MTMYAKSSLLVTAAVTALIVAGILSSSIMTSVDAIRSQPRNCYTYATGGACFYTMGDCKKDEARFVSGGGTVERHCFKNV